MKFRKYLMDKGFSLVLWIIMYLILLLLMFAFKTEGSMVVAVTVIMSGFYFADKFLQKKKIL